MSLSEIIQLFDGYTLVALLSLMLLHIFVRRFLRRRDLLSKLGVVSIPILLLLICWIAWGRYNLASATLNAVYTANPAITLTTTDKTILADPAIVKEGSVRFIVDRAIEQPKYYHAWDIIPIRQE